MTIKSTETRCWLCTVLHLLSLARQTYFLRGGKGENTSGNNRQVSVLSKNVHHVTRGIIIYHMRVRNN